jgi:hypothetical protein
VSFPLPLVVDPAFEPRLDRALWARCLFDDRCPAPRRRAEPPSLESRPSSRAGRLQVPLPTATRTLPCLAMVSYLCSDERTPSPARCRHPHAEHTTVEQRPCLSWARSRVSTDLCRVHFPACCHPVYVPCRAHVVGVVPSPQLCRRPFTRTHQHRIEALFFLAEPVHAHSRTREVVRWRMSPTNAAGPFLAVFPFSVPLPSAHHQFCVAAMAEPSAFGTHTYARHRGAEPPTSPICDSARRSAVPSLRTPTHRRTCARRAIDSKFEPFWPP